MESGGKVTHGGGGTWGTVREGVGGERGQLWIMEGGQGQEEATGG